MNLKLEKSGLLTLSRKSEVIWQQAGTAGASLYVDAKTNQMKLGNELVVVGCDELRSSWPFAGYVTALYSNPLARQAAALLITVAAGFVGSKALGSALGIFFKSPAKSGLPKSVTAMKKAAKKVAAKKPLARKARIVKR